MNASNSCGHGHMLDRTFTLHIWVRDAERMADMNERALIRASFHVFFSPFSRFGSTPRRSCSCCNKNLRLHVSRACTSNMSQSACLRTLSTLYLGMPCSLPHDAGTLTDDNLIRRYFQSQGLFTVPTQIILVVAPLNAFLNWLLGVFAVPPASQPTKSLLCSMGSPSLSLGLHRRAARLRH